MPLPPACTRRTTRLACYPYSFDHRRCLKIGAGRRCAEIAGAIPHVVCSTLIITIGAHGVEGVGYMLGRETYTALQLLTIIILPLVRAFRGAPGRPADASVVVLLNCCDVPLPLWSVLMRDLPAGDSFTLVSFRLPLLLADIPGVLASLVRSLTNDSLRLLGYTPAHCLASAMTWQFERAAQPMLLESGGAPAVTSFLRPFTDFLFHPVFPSPALVAASVGSPPVSAPFAPALVAAANSPPLPLSAAERTSLVVDYISSLTPDERFEQGVDVVGDRTELVGNLNDIAEIVANGAAFPPFDAAKNGTFNKRTKARYWANLACKCSGHPGSHYEWRDEPLDDSDEEE